jgi:Mycolic acid cyclopropane synthetase
MAERIYAIHSDEECERLEAQAQLVPLSIHLKHLPLKPGASDLDAGCGSGSMSRQIAKASRVWHKCEMPNASSQSEFGGKAENIYSG